VIVIGDEILSGHVRDANSSWLADRLQSHGVPLDRVVTVPDQRDAIVEALHTELARARPRLVLTSGGVGSTPDDLTYESVAAALGVDLVIEPQLQSWIDAMLERTATAGIPVSDDHATSLLRMAQVPDGAYLLAPEGFAPGVAVDVDGGLDVAGVTIVILPGIPRELRRITRESVEARYLDGRGEPQHVVELHHPFPESVLNPALTQVVREFPAVHVGSYPGRDCIVRLKGLKDDVEAAAEVIEAAIAEVGRLPGAEQLAASWQAHWRDDGD
jgi:molybdenum cofactor synthesis domain-containing protein